MSSLAGVTGVSYPPTRIKVYDGENPTIKRALDKHLPIKQAPAPPNVVSNEATENAAYFHSVRERQIWQELREEGRAHPIEAVEGLGVPENWGELVTAITRGDWSFLLGLNPIGLIAGKPSPPSHHQATTKIAGQTVPTSNTEEGSSESGEKEAGSTWAGLSGILEKAGLTVVLALAGLALVIYGVMIAVKPRERAFSLGLS